MESFLSLSSTFPPRALSLTTLQGIEYTYTCILTGTVHVHVHVPVVCKGYLVRYTNMYITFCSVQLCTMYMYIQNVRVYMTCILTSHFTSIS